MERTGGWRGNLTCRERCGPRQINRRAAIRKVTIARATLAAAAIASPCFAHPRPEILKSLCSMRVALTPLPPSLHMPALISPCATGRVLGAIVRGFQGKDCQNRTRPGRYLARWRAAMVKFSVPEGVRLRLDSSAAIRLKCMGEARSDRQSRLESRPKIRLRWIRAKRAGMPAIPTLWEARRRAGITDSTSEPPGPGTPNPAGEWAGSFGCLPTQQHQANHSRLADIRVLEPAGQRTAAADNPTPHRRVLHQTTTKGNAKQRAYSCRVVVMSRERRQPSAQLRTQRAGGGFIGTSRQAMGAYEDRHNPQRKDGRGVFRNAEVFSKQAGTWPCVFDQSHRWSGRRPRSVDGGSRSASVRPHRVPHRPASNGSSPNQPPHRTRPAWRLSELMAHRAGRTGGRVVRRRGGRDERR